MDERGALVVPCSGNRSPFADTAEADESVYAQVGQQVAWRGIVQASGSGPIDPQDWLFAERERYRRLGSCDPWAEQMLRRAGMLPRDAA